MSILDVISLLPLVYLAVATLPLVLVDLREHRLPNKIVLPFAALSFITVIVVNVANQSWLNLLLAVGLPFTWFIIGIVLNYFDVIGMGDVKFLTALLLAVGVYSPLIALLIIPLSALLSIVAIVYVIMLKAPVGTSVPLGPWLLLSTWLVVGVLASSAW
jgi:leader peptidase (prepilin peptidase) / N-methyltransferase